jgi:hypothetical protein
MAGASKPTPFTVCTARHATLSVVQGISGAGHSSEVILVMNKGSKTCRLTGYPGLQLLDAQGIVAGTVDRTRTGFTGALRPGMPIPIIELQRGEVASAVMEGTDIPAGTASSCPSYDSFEVTLPDQTTPVTIHKGTGSCSGFDVHPFVIGFNGSYPTGEIIGRAPTCARSLAGGSPIGPVVPIEAWSGTTLSGEVEVFASATATQRYQLILRPGRYRIVSGQPKSSVSVVLRSGRVDNLGRYGTCTRPDIPRIYGSVPTTSSP